MIADPPSLPGAVHSTVTSPSSTTSGDVTTGTSGAPSGVTVSGSDVASKASALVTTTTTLYSTPLTRPPIVHDNGLASVGTVEQVGTGSTRMVGSAGMAVTV